MINYDLSLWNFGLTKLTYNFRPVKRIFPICIYNSNQLTMSQKRQTICFESSNK